MGWRTNFLWGGGLIRYGVGTNLLWGGGLIRYGVED